MRMKLLALLVLCGGAHAQDEQRIKVVSSLPRTGSAKAQTDGIVNAIRMAFEEADWKVGAFRIAYEDWDDSSPQRGTWDLAAEAANARKAVGDPDVMAYIGTYNSGAAKVSMPVLNEAGLVMISPANTYPGLTKPGLGEPGEPKAYRPSGKVNYFRVVPSDDIQGAVGAEWARRTGLQSAFVLHDGEPYGGKLCEAFKVRAAKVGLSVKATEAMNPRADDYSELAARVKGAAPDFVYFGGTTQSNAGRLAKDLAAAGFAGKLLVPDGCYEEAFLQAAGAENLNDRCFVTFGALAPDKLTGMGKEFVQKYEKKHGTAPDAYAVYAYEAARVAIEAIRRAGRKDREAVRAACAALRDYDGALGRWSFDENGDTTLRVMSIYRVHGGRFEFVEAFGPSGGLRRYK